MKKIEVVFEDKDLLVVNKSAGVVVNRAETVHEETLQDWAHAHLKLRDDDLGIGDRAGIVHRIDRDTSGLVIIAKGERSFEFLQSQFKNREVWKKYIGLVHGSLINSGKVEQRIGRIGAFGKFGVKKDGREAETEYKVISKFQFKIAKFQGILESGNFDKNRVRYLKAHGFNYSLVEFYPKTGRTHQIRVHAKHIGHPVVSDLIYCPGKLLKFDLSWCPRLFLHAAEILFSHPKTGKKLHLKAPLPQELEAALSQLTIA